MSETTTAATTASRKAAEKTVAAVSNTLPTVVDTVEVAMEVPAKVVLNQRLVVLASVVGGTALGAVGLWGFQKLQTKRRVNKLNQQLDTPTTGDAVA